MELRSIGISTKNNRKICIPRREELLFYYFLYLIEFRYRYVLNESIIFEQLAFDIYYESSTIAIKILRDIAFPTFVNNRLDGLPLCFTRNSFSPLSLFFSRIIHPKGNTFLYRQDNKIYAFSKCFGIIVSISLDLSIAGKVHCLYPFFFIFVIY